MEGILYYKNFLYKLNERELYMLRIYTAVAFVCRNMGSDKRVLTMVVIILVLCLASQLVYADKGTASFYRRPYTREYLLRLYFSHILLYIYMRPVIRNALHIYNPKFKILDFDLQIRESRKTITSGHTHACGFRLHRLVLYILLLS